MTQKEFFTEVSKKTGVSAAEAKKIVMAYFEIAADEICKGNSVQLPIFGVLKKAAVAEKQGRNPSTGESITVPAHSRCKLKSSKNTEIYKRLNN